MICHWRAHLLREFLWDLAQAILVAQLLLLRMLAMKHKWNSFFSFLKTSHEFNNNWSISHHQQYQHKEMPKITVPVDKPEAPKQSKVMQEETRRYHWCEGLLWHPPWELYSLLQWLHQSPNMHVLFLLVFRSDLEFIDYFDLISLLSLAISPHLCLQDWWLDHTRIYDWTLYFSMW